MAEVQVPLDTIPISPPDGHPNYDSNGSSPAPSHAVTVFDDPDNFNVKHPLMNKWTLWFTKPQTGKVWQSTVTQASRQTG
jgi:translation initiation factor 4E